MPSNISIFGTSSDAGKSTVTLILSKLLQQRGFSVAPFKAQNVSNNARVANDNSEIAIAQYFQSEALGIKSSWHNNPVLLKSGRGNSASLIVRGKAISTPNVREYYKDLDSLKPIVKEAFLYLDRTYDIVVAEGAGSPVELNLMDKDLSNLFVAKEFKTKIILVADIEKGGVFASIYGVYNLLPKELRDNVIGVIVNKFRGDMSLFYDGVKIIEERFKIPVIGVLPYRSLNLGFEDSQSLLNYTQRKESPAKRVAIIAYPTMSNYNDFEPLIVRSDIEVDFIKSNIPLDSYDLVILPGSKLVMSDLEWLKRVGLDSRLKSRKREILGICGGYEMMFEKLIDLNCIESSTKEMRGLGFIDDTIYFQNKKIVKRGKYRIFNKEVDGFEIHNGISKKYPLFFEKNNIKGTFVHAIFEDESFKAYQKSEIDSFVKEMEEFLDIDRVIREIV